MDLLSNSQARRAILHYYQASGEPQAVQEAIKVSEQQAMRSFTLQRIKHENTGYVHIPLVEGGGGGAIIWKGREKLK